MEKEIVMQQDARDKTSDGDGPSRESLAAEYAELKAKNKQLKTDISQYERCDPAKMIELKAKTKTCQEAAIRWTDNLFEMESWMKKNNPSLSTEDIGNNFPVLKDLDYP